MQPSFRELFRVVSKQDPACRRADSRTFIFGCPLHRRESHIRDIVVGDGLERYFCILSSVSPKVNHEQSKNMIRERNTYHRYTPTLSTCAVAKKSFVGENAILVATLDVLNASIKRPVGTSNVRIIESNEVVTSHRESGENACRRRLLSKMTVER